MGWDKEALETKFRLWSKPLGVSEDERCANACRLISETLRDADELERYGINVFAQGSFRNNTNIVGESDVDLCALCNASIFPDLSGVIPITKEQVGLGPPSFTYRQYKDDVYAVLRRRFGAGCVRGDKAIQIHANSYRIDADVIACLEGRKYSWPNLEYLVGTAFYPDSGPAVVFNWPSQHIENGIAKNLVTGKRFKFVARILKSLRDDLPAPHGDLPSFLVECLAYNAGNECFGNDRYVDDVQSVLVSVGRRLIERPNEMFEVNGIKPLFGGGQPWTVDKAMAFVSAALAVLLGG